MVKSAKAWQILMRRIVFVGQNTQPKTAPKHKWANEETKLHLLRKAP